MRAGAGSDSPPGRAPELLGHRGASVQELTLGRPCPCQCARGEGWVAAAPSSADSAFPGEGGRASTVASLLSSSPFLALFGRRVPLHQPLPGRPSPPPQAAPLGTGSGKLHSQAGVLQGRLSEIPAVWLPPDSSQKRGLPPSILAPAGTVGEQLIQRLQGPAPLPHPAGQLAWAAGSCVTQPRRVVWL